MYIDNIIELGKSCVNIISKRLYTIVAVPAAYIAYKFLKALMKEDDKGNSIFGSISNTISNATKEAQELSDKCPELIGNFSDFLNCLGF